MASNTITIHVVLDTKDVSAATDKIRRSIKSAIDPSITSVDALRAASSRLTSALATLGGLAVLRQIGQFAVDLDRSRNAMAALTGSVDAANKKLAELRNLAKTSPGVTNTFATQLFNQLKATREITDKTINDTIKGLGKLNVVFANVGPEFARNLIQIFKTSFERDDVKQAINAVPIFEQLLKGAFGTDDPDKLRKLKASGKLTMDVFLQGINEQINKRFPELQESLGGKLAKAFDETKVKLAELGERILKDLIPILDKLIPVINAILDVFTKLPVGLQAAAVAFIALPGPILGVIPAVQSLSTAFLGLGTAMQATLGIAGLVLVGGGLAFTQLQKEINENIPRNIQQQLNPQGLTIDPRTKLPLIPGADTTFTFGGKAGATTASPLDAIRAAAAAIQTDAKGKGENEAARKAKEAAKKRAEEIKDLQEKIREARDVADQTNIDRLAQLSKDINAQNIAEAERIRALGGRPAQLAGFSASNVERLRQIDLETLRLEENTAKKAAEALKKNEELLSSSERFMRGFRDATLSVGDAFDRFGQSVADAFLNVRDLFSGLKRAVLDFFNDLIGSTLQNLVRGTLGSIFGGGGGIGNFFRSLTGGGISAPGSVSGGASVGAVGILGPISSILSGGRGGGSAAGGGFSLGALGGSLAAAAPLLGASFGSAFGGQSTAGKILGAIGGGAVGVGALFGASVFGAGGGLAAASLAALGPAALIGAPLLIGAILLGKASQRRKDEQASGQMLTAALDAIQQLRGAIDSDQVDGASARGIFESQILGGFVQQINTLKTRSVRESRLTNQVGDLRKVYNDLIPPAIAAQAARRQTSASNAFRHSQLIPEFATGGTTLGGLALLHPGEKVLNLQQQTAIRMRAGGDVFERAGVPGMRPDARFEGGGIFMGGGSGPIEITLDAQVVISEKTATGIYVVGGSSNAGRGVTVNNVKVARTNREL